jgi:hypothetical protein
MYLVITDLVARIAYNGTVLVCEAHGVGLDEI